MISLMVMGIPTIDSSSRVVQARVLFVSANIEKCNLFFLIKQSGLHFHSNENNVFDVFNMFCDIFLMMEGEN